MFCFRERTDPLANPLAVTLICYLNPQRSSFYNINSGKCVNVSGGIDTTETPEVVKNFFSEIEIDYSL